MTLSKFAKPDTTELETVFDVDLKMRFSGDAAKRIEANATVAGVSPADFLCQFFSDAVDCLPKKPRAAKPSQEDIEIPSWVPADLHSEYRYIAKTVGEEDAAAWARGAKRGMA